MLMMLRDADAASHCHAYADIALRDYRCRRHAD